jgi:hypothetical protein
MLDAGIRRQLFFQRGHLRPENPLTAFDRGFDGLIERLAEADALCLKVDERNGLDHVAFSSLD